MLSDERALGLLMDIRERVRSIEDRLEAEARMVSSIEDRLRKVELLHTTEERVDDHEQRLRALERWKHYAMGLVTAVGAVVSAAVSFLKDKLTT